LPNERERNVLEAMNIALKVYQRGHTPVVPLLSHFLDTFWVARGVRAPYSFWLKEAISLLLDCDAVLFAKEWLSSRGCRIEHELVTTDAQTRNGKPMKVFYDVKEIPRRQPPDDGVDKYL